MILTICFCFVLIYVTLLVGFVWLGLTSPEKLEKVLDAISSFLKKYLKKQKRFLDDFTSRS